MFTHNPHRTFDNNIDFLYSLFLPTLTRNIRARLSDLAPLAPILKLPYAIEHEQDIQQLSHCAQQLNRLGISNESIAAFLEIVDNNILFLYEYSIRQCVLSIAFYAFIPSAINFRIIGSATHLFSLWQAWNATHEKDIESKRGKINRIIIQITHKLLLQPGVMEKLLGLQQQWRSANAPVVINGNKYFDTLEKHGFPFLLVPEEYNCCINRTIMEWPIKLGKCSMIYDWMVLSKILNRPLPNDPHAAIDPFTFTDPTTKEVRTYPDDVHIQEDLANEIKTYFNALIENIMTAQRRCFGLFKRHISPQEYAELSTRAMTTAKVAKRIENEHKQKPKS